MNNVPRDAIFCINNQIIPQNISCQVILTSCKDRNDVENANVLCLVCYAKNCKNGAFSKYDLRSLILTYRGFHNHQSKYR